MVAIEVPDVWQGAIARILSGDWRHVVVIGPTDVGKSSFIRALAERRAFALLDLDPGQKMFGPPGTVSRGHWTEHGGPVCDRFAFVGSTSALAIARIVRGALRLRTDGPLIANTSGFVLGPGARLQAATIAALDADLVVAIGLDAPPVPKGWSKPLIALPRSPLAQRKSQRLRRRIRQAALDRHLGSDTIDLPRASVAFEPGPPVSFLASARPLCALADAAGEDMSVGVLLSAEADKVLVRGSLPPRTVSCIRLGSLWAEPAAEGWRLLDGVKQAWGIRHRGR
jgi:hypothetical protein